MIVTDVEGKIGCKAFGDKDTKGMEFAVHFTDMYSRFSAVYFMKRKSEVDKMFQRFITEHCIPNGALR